MNRIGCQYDGSDKTNRQQTFVLVSHHIVDSVRQRFKNLVWDNMLQLKQQFVLQTVEWQEGDEREHEDKQRRQRHQERESQTLGSPPEVAVGNTAQQIAHHVIQRHPFVARQGDIVHPVAEIFHHPTMDHTIPTILYLLYQIQIAILNLFMIQTLD